MEDGLKVLATIGIVMAIAIFGRVMLAAVGFAIVFTTLGHAGWGPPRCRHWRNYRGCGCCDWGIRQRQTGGIRIDYCIARRLLRCAMFSLQRGTMASILNDSEKAAN